jgi:hypothetical protein
LFQRRVSIALVTVLLLSVVLIDAAEVWALSVTPTPPIAGQPFAVDNDAPISESITVYAGPGCSGPLILSETVPAGGILPVPGQPAGQYSTNTDFEPGCLNFAIIPVAIAHLGSSSPPN